LVQGPANAGGPQRVGEYDGDFRAWRWKNVAFFGWIAPSCTPAARAYAALVDSMVKSAGPTKLSMIHVVAKNLSLPVAEPRAIVSEVLRVQSAHLACVAALVEGTGFWLSAMRSYTTSLLALTTRGFEMRMHGEVDELLGWFPQAHQRRTGIELGGAELRGHIEAARLWCRGGRPDSTRDGPAP
jgi:hypothetical protein